MINKKTLQEIGWPRIIIALFLVVLFIFGHFIQIDIRRSIVDVLTRFGMNAILVLAMIPMVQSGCGLNFGLPVGLIGGMLGAVISLEFKLTGLPGVLLAIVLGMFFGAVFGYFYGKILNKVKGDEMIIATYVGFSFVALMNIVWVILPFKNPTSVMGYKGKGLRVTISLREYWDKAISKIGGINIDLNPVGSTGHIPKVLLPVGMILFFILFAVIVLLFFKSKKGSAMTAVGSNSTYAKATGINIDRYRTASVMMSCALAAVGMVIYQQSFGFVQMYNAPLAFAFPSVAAILLGGASVKKANIFHVLIGTLLFQGILTMTPSVINKAIRIDISDVLRLIISYGMIVYALTRGGKK